MNCTHNQSNSDDSDIIEVAILPPRDASSSPRCSSPIPKRRKSSPKMDPIPSYTFDSKPTSSDTHSRLPVMWSPKLPSQIEPVKTEEEDKNVGYQPPRAAKSRVAHRPTIAVNKKNRPKLPRGTSKKVPQTFRAKFLDVIITEYLNTGHKEDESYEEALKEEQLLATRAANKNIYVNLVASLKKRIRENAAQSIKSSKDSKSSDETN